MKNKRLNWRFLFLTCIGLYIIAVGLSFVIIKNVPDSYVDVQKKTNVKVNNLIEEAVKNNDKESYQVIIDNYLVDFVVYNKTNSQIEFTSINIEDNLNVLKQNVNENIISNKSALSITRDNQELEVWVIKYYISPQETFDTWIIALISVVAVLLSIVTVSLIILFMKYVKPLDRLRQTVQKISAFQLEKISNVNDSSEYDQINKKLSEFSLELDKRIKDTGYKYSELEKSLIIKNESISYQNKMLASLAHDLKAPLSLLNLNLEELKNYNNLMKIQQMQGKVDTLIMDINNINKIVFEDNLALATSQEFDLIEVLLQVFTKYQELFKQKDFYTEFDLSDKIIIKSNKVRMQQLIDNALSNIYQHANKSGDVIISCWLEDNEIILSFYNDATNIKDEDLAKLTTLFYSKSNSKYSSGIGLNTIQTIVTELKGQLLLEKVANGLLVKVVLPYEK